MIVWRDYLAMLAEDGVSLGETEEEALSDEDERVHAYFMVRTVQGKMLHAALPYKPDPNERVPRSLQRQIANKLRLPPEKYIFRQL